MIQRCLSYWFGWKHRDGIGNQYTLPSTEVSASSVGELQHSASEAKKYLNYTTADRHLHMASPIPITDDSVIDMYHDLEYRFKDMFPIYRDHQVGVQGGLAIHITPDPKLQAMIIEHHDEKDHIRTWEDWERYLVTLPAFVSIPLTWESVRKMYADLSLRFLYVFPDFYDNPEDYPRRAITIEPNQKEGAMTIDHFYAQDMILVRTWGEWLHCLDTEMSELLR